MSIHWICSTPGCGFESESGTDAFKHRSGDAHFVQPIRTADEPQLLITRSEYSGLRVIRSMGEA